MKFDEILGTDSLYLRQLQESDVTPGYIEWLNDPLVNQFLEVRKLIPNLAEQQKYVKLCLDSKNRIMLGIFLTGEVLIGSTTLTVSENHSAEIGIMIGEKSCHGQGIGKRVIALIVNWASKNGFQSLTAGYDLRNRASARLFYSSGFKELDTIPNTSSNMESEVFQRTIMQLQNPRGR